MKFLFSDARNALQFIATLAIALSGAVVMIRHTTPVHDPAPPVSRASSPPHAGAATRGGQAVGPAYRSVDPIDS